MKKALTVLFSLVLFSSLVAPFFVEASGVSPGQGSTMEGGCQIRRSFTIDTPRGPETIQRGWMEDIRRDWAIVCMLHMVYYVTDWIFYIIIIGAGIMILYAAFLYLLAQGDPTSVGKANKLIIFAIIGLVIALMARAIPSAVRYIVGM